MTPSSTTRVRPYSGVRPIHQGATSTRSLAQMKAQTSSKPVRTSTTGNFSSRSTALALRKSANSLVSAEKEVRKMKISDYYNVITNTNQQSSHSTTTGSFAIDLLDRIISVEENMMGKPLFYNRGQELLKGLID